MCRVGSGIFINCSRVTHNSENFLQPRFECRPHRLQRERGLVRLQDLYEMHEYPAVRAVLGHFLAVQQQCRAGQVDEQTEQDVRDFVLLGLADQLRQQVRLQHFSAAQVAAVLVSVGIPAKNPNEMLRRQSDKRSTFN